MPLKQRFFATMATIGVLAMLLAATCCLAHAAELPHPRRVDQERVKREALQGFVEILNLWRDGEFSALYLRTIPMQGKGRGYFVEQLLYASRRPACCWEQLQDVTLTYLDEQRATLTAKLGMEVEGVGTRFVSRSFYLVEEAGVWKVPMVDILDLAEPNLQRIPAKIPLQPLP